MTCVSCKEPSLKELQQRVDDLKKKTKLLEEQLKNLEKKDNVKKKTLIFLD